MICRLDDSKYYFYLNELLFGFGFRRLGIRSLVLESADALRAEGYALALWPNAWKALDAIGIGGLLRRQHNQLVRYSRRYIFHYLRWLMNVPSAGFFFFKLVTLPYRY